MSTATVNKPRPVTAETPVAHPMVEATARPPDENLAQAARSAPRLPTLAAALAAAQQKCRRVPHDARNDFHKYDYTSSEAVIEEAKRALADTGLALVPLEQSLDGYERTGQNRFEMVRRWLLMHTGGESLPISVRWPVVEERGRPLDKAAAIASTLSLSYLLRDLLQMPRVDLSDEVAAQDDRPRPAPQNRRREKPPSPAKEPEPTNWQEFDAWLRRADAFAALKYGLPPGELSRRTRSAGQQEGWGTDLLQWPLNALPHAIFFVREELKKLRQQKEASRGRGDRQST